MMSITTTRVLVTKCIIYFGKIERKLVIIIIFLYILGNEVVGFDRTILKHFEDL